jgi:hypothetical protein
MSKHLLGGSWSKAASFRFQNIGSGEMDDIGVMKLGAAEATGIGKVTGNSERTRRNRERDGVRLYGRRGQLRRQRLVKCFDGCKKIICADAVWSR